MKTIQELIDFVEAIPEENWASNTFEIIGKDDKKTVKRCIAGHLNHHLTGNAWPLKDEYGNWASTEPCLPLLKDMGIDREHLVQVNNWGRGGPKKAVLEFLKGKK